jgi:glycosyltransferase involved in cell wall biosynthesis
MNIKNATCYSFHLNGEESLAYLRLIGPLRKAGIGIVKGIRDEQVIVDRVSEGDIVVILREFPRRFGDFKRIIETAHKTGKPVVFDLDDLLFFLPENHPDRQAQNFVSSLLPMFQAMTESDIITVSTPRLKNVLGRYHDNVIVLPNYFDDDIWHLKPPVPKKSGNEMISIGYMGGYSHKPDLEYIAPVLRNLIERYSQRLHFHFWGIEPPEEIRSLPQVTTTLSYHYSYIDFANYFQTQSADIFLSPLVDNLFNRCKSPIKFFEYSALGAPGVFSDLETYQEVITHGKNGLLASSLDEWSDCIIQLIEDEELRFRLATNAQATIQAGWLLSQNSFRWQETYRDIAKPSFRTARDSKEDIVESINYQLVEMFTKKEAEIKDLSRKVQALNGQVAERERLIDEITYEKAQAEAEAVQYALSTSWRITRPLRKIMNKIRKGN